MLLDWKYKYCKQASVNSSPNWFTVKFTCVSLFFWVVDKIILKFTRKSKQQEE